MSADAEVFTVDTRAVFTVHKARCAHLRLVSGRAVTFDIECAASRQAILAELSEFATSEDEDPAVFAPCVSHLLTEAAMS